MATTARPVLTQNGYDYAFAGVKHLFGNAPIVFGNLEGPLTDRGTAEQDKTYTFRSPPDKVSRALVGAGFNVVSLANNHTLDYGADGLAQTLETLDAAGIAYAGAGPDLKAARRPAILEAGALTGSGRCAESAPLVSRASCAPSGTCRDRP